VHSIETLVHGGRSAFVTGVVVVSSRERSLRCVIMTLEGLAVFEAEWDGQLKVNRAIAPFDSKLFAQGLIEDIRLLFLRPPGSPLESGILENGSSICRYRVPEEGIVDVVSQEEGRWEIRRYAADFKLLRTLRIAPDTVELTAHGPRGYKLNMNLLEAVRIEE